MEAGGEIGVGEVHYRHVCLAYQPPASGTFLSQQTSHQQSTSSIFLSERISTSHQPPDKQNRPSTRLIDPSPASSHWSDRSRRIFLMHE
jgi:hypothetical protein